MTDTTEQANTLCTEHRSDTVAHFAHLPEEALAALKERLGLSMSTAVLATLSTYYRGVGRDPLTRELCLIDGYWRSCRAADVAHGSLTSLKTRDGALADTLHALLASCREADGKTSPLTLERALTAHGERGACDPTLSDRERSARRMLLTDEAYGALALQGLKACESICVEGESLRLASVRRIVGKCAHAPKKKDLIALLVLPPSADADTYGHLETFWSQSISSLHDVQTVTPGTLWATLADMAADGCYTDPSVLRATHPKSGLCPETVRGYLVCADQAAMRTLLSLAKELQLDMTAFARISGDGMWTVAERDATPFSLPVSLLRALRRHRQAAVELMDMPAPCVPTKDRRTPLRSATGWKKAVYHPAGKPLALGDLTVIHTTLPLPDALSPTDVMQAVMRAALRLTAAGGDCRKLSAAVALSVSEQTSPCALWSCVLGLRRILDDWHADALPPVVRSYQEAGSLTVFLLAPTVRPAPLKQVSEPHWWRLLPVTADTHGLPDHKQLHAMLCLTSQALLEGRILGLCPLWEQIPAKALGGVGELCPPRAVIGGLALNQPTTGLLVYGDRSLSYGMAIGAAKEERPPKEAAVEKTSIQAPSRYSSVHHSTPTVLIPVLASTPPTKALTDELVALGARPLLLPVEPTHQGCTALADAVRDAQIVLLCGDADVCTAILRHRRVRFALYTHLEQDGMLFALRGAQRAIAQSEFLSGWPTHLATPVPKKLKGLLHLCPHGMTDDQLARAIRYYQ